MFSGIFNIIKTLITAGLLVAPIVLAITIVLIWVIWMVLNQEVKELWEKRLSGIFRRQGNS